MPAWLAASEASQPDFSADDGAKEPDSACAGQAAREDGTGHDRRSRVYRCEISQATCTQAEHDAGAENEC